MVEIDTLSQTKTAEKNIPFGAAHTSLYKGLPPPPNDEEVANSSKKNIPNSRLDCTNHILLQTKNGRNWHPISDQNGWKNIPFGAAHSSLYKGIPPPPSNQERVIYNSF